MVAITRVDIPSQPADKCRFEITWIASDPLRAISMDEKIEHISDWPPNRHRTVAENRADRLQLSRDMCDFDSIYGCSQSWTAKAIRIFPALKNMCQNAIPEDALGYVRMLTLTDTSRAESIFEQNQLTTLEPELTKFTYEMSRDIATIKIGDIKQLRNQIKRYF
ncbi:hypothetical protein GGI15_001316 [Coemansia interrupta]|uniref:Uncharacterized protein n=1 Tax=Coemansia interrupta TaxID=1126814 RepID=A0A9W8LNQ6_9FUNG|nr:hypothetical protein GGI15_001316 [Coemansia interrupta]